MAQLMAPLADVALVQILARLVVVVLAPTPVAPALELLVERLGDVIVRSQVGEAGGIDSECQG